MDYPVIISYCNDGYYSFAKNMLYSLNNNVKNHKVHFYCLDQEIYDKLTQLELNITVVFELVKNVNISKHFENYGTHLYNAITHTKMNILRDALSKYPFIHFIDCDVVCMKEPTLDHYHNYRKYDIVFQYDCGMKSLDNLYGFHPLNNPWCCTGNTSLRHTPATCALLDKIIEYQTRYPDKNDQECLYQYFKDISVNDISLYEHAALYTYELCEYTNGYWLNNDIGPLDRTYFFHANHVCGSYDKMRLLKKAGQYFI
jgi:hypothetical protein